MNVVEHAGVGSFDRKSGFSRGVGRIERATRAGTARTQAAECFDAIVAARAAPTDWLALWLKP